MPPKDGAPKPRNFRRTQGVGNNRGRGKDENGTSGSTNRRPRLGHKKLNGEVEHTISSTTTSEETQIDEEVCLICASKLDYVAVSECSHKVCYKCAFRGRALYGKRNCLICRTENSRLVFTENTDEQFSTFNSFQASDDKYGIDFTSNKIANATLALMKYTCSMKHENEYTPTEPDHDFGSASRFNEHLKSAHNRCICLTCASHNHLFPQELPILTPNKLRIHQSRGDTEGFKGHPMCAFCTGTRFYSDDELYVHMRNKHEKCHVCDRANHKAPQYFKDYDQLFQHFKNEHYICTVQSCLDDKFVVFGDELELQAHILQEHGDIIKGKPKLYQSGLSTFIAAPSRVVREDQFQVAGQSRHQRIKKDVSDEDDPETSLRKLNERAKHYLEGSLDKFDDFVKLNNEYDKGYLSSSSLLQSYKLLFVGVDSMNVSLLINNLAHTYNSNSPKRKDLMALYESQETVARRNMDLPSLSNDIAANVTSGGATWANSSRSSSSRNLRSLPSLQSPPPNFDPFKNNHAKQPRAPIGYNKNLVSRPKPSLPTAVCDAQTKKITPSIPKSTVQMNAKKIDLSELPSLPTPKPTRAPLIERPAMPDPKQWGKDTVKKTNQDSLDLALVHSNNKKKGKQKQLLLHIGI